MKIKSAKCVIRTQACESYGVVHLHSGSRLTQLMSSINDLPTRSRHPYCIEEPARTIVP